MLNLKPWVDKIAKKIKKASSPEVMEAVGNLAAQRIRLRTRLGHGVKGNGQAKQPLKTMRKHSKRYADWRANNPFELSGDTAPKKHNLTLTGDMLDDIKVIKITPRRVELGFDDSFSELKATVNQARGWRFMYLSDVEIKAVYNFYRREVAKLVKGN